MTFIIEDTSFIVAVLDGTVFFMKMLGK